MDTAEFEPLLAGRCTLHDPLAVAVAEDPSLVTTIELPLTVDLEGPARGRTVGSIAGVLTDAPSVKVAVGLDAPRFVGRFESRLLAFARGLGA